MEGCNDSGLLVGKNVVLEVALGCADTVPTEVDWQALAAGTSKTIDFSPNTVTSDADDKGAWVDNAITNADATISFEGEVRKNDALDQFGFGKFVKYFTDEMNAKRQPTLWVRVQLGPIEFVGYMVATALSTDGGTNDIVTFSTEFKVYDGNTVAVTLINDVPVTGITVAPTSLAIEMGTPETFTITFAPAGATNKNYTVVSDNTGVATVAKTGNIVTVTPVAVGTANVIVRTEDGDFVKVVDVGVSA
ncbi:MULTISPECIES: Ig-like domain-containing protein [Enterobacterales]|uniref:Ig-like domain-containing protein n=1 Tax=Enterobacterales TaxID=91347 RepID=UPI000F8EED9B|nr:MULTISPECIES: Ig-like domain-containing protein [Enterobacterales]AZS56801.1 DNA breaking-rejoining protein [Pectobacterium parmentieri]MBI0431703.1 DNA breaking-rejoining protein [Pectobacterium parmentieri]MCW2477755.1 Ig-like domain-containing protein [Candidatus Symbiopectobacterium sp. NZEC135]